ncbi:MAG: radical SAM/SPASM domain-containing protein [Candidatus Falkowbacteria bacterium]
MKFKTILLSEPSTFRQLAEVLPLKAPFSVLIDPGNLCNFRCSFCPTGHPQLLKKVARPNGMMDFSLFCKIIDDLRGFGRKLEKINLYKDGEPFLNRNLARMIAYAKNKKISKNISTTSNGLLIDESRAIEIIEAGLDSIRISVEHVTDAGYKKITGTPTQYESIRKNVEFLFKSKEKRKSALKIHTKIIDTGLSNLEKDKFIKDFAGISDSINIDLIDGRNNTHGYDFTLGRGIFSITDYANNPLKKDRKVCPDPFFSMAVNFNGLVSVCCVDWSLDTIMGDANKESLVDIWRGEKLREFRIMHLNGERKKINICANCQVLQGAPMESDLDDAADSLLGAYEKSKTAH